MRLSRLLVRCGFVVWAMCLAGTSAFAIPPKPIFSAAATAPALKMAPEAVTAVPSAPHYTTNYATCKNNGGDDLVCKKLITDNWIAFYWTYNCGGCTVANFSLSRADTATGSVRGGIPDHATVATQSNLASLGPQAGMTKPFEGMSQPSGGWNGACFAVTATRGAPPSGVAAATTGPKTCVTATTQTVKIAPSHVRQWNRAYFIKNDQRGISNAVHTALPFIAGDTRYDAQGLFSASFNRSAFDFDRAAIGSASILGGRFAYDVDTTSNVNPLGCVAIYSPAQTGWQSSDWIMPQGSPITGALFAFAKPTVSAPIAKTLQSWETGPLSFMLLEQPQAELSNYALQPMNDCPFITNVRLIVTTGIDV